MSINQIIATAVAEKLSTLMIEDYLAESADVPVGVAIEDLVAWQAKLWNESAKGR